MTDPTTMDQDACDTALAAWSGELRATKGHEDCRGIGRGLCHQHPEYRAGLSSCHGIGYTPAVTLEKGMEALAPRYVNLAPMSGLGPEKRWMAMPAWMPPMEPPMYGPTPLLAWSRALVAAIRKESDPDAGLELRPEIEQRLRDSRLRPHKDLLTAQEMQAKLDAAEGQG